MHESGSRVCTKRDVVEASKALEGKVVQPGVEGPERDLTLRKQVVVEKRDYACRDLSVGGQRGIRRWTETPTGVAPLVPCP